MAKCQAVPSEGSAVLCAMEDPIGSETLVERVGVTVTVIVIVIVQPKAVLSFLVNR